MEKINLKADFFTFKNEIEEKFGQQYYEQAELFFERAIEQGNQGLIESAINDMKFAKDLINYSNDKSGFPYMLGFLSQLHCDQGKIKEAWAYYELGLKLLDVDEEGYDDDVELYARLKEHIESENWKDSLDE